MAYCKYYDCECYSPFCSVYPHSINNICPYIIATKKELKEMEESYQRHVSITQEEIDEEILKNLYDKKEDKD